MSNTKISEIITQTITLTTTTPGLTIAVNAPGHAIGVEVQGTGASTPTWNLTPRLQKAWWYDVAPTPTYTDITDSLSDRTSAQAINSFDGAAAAAGDLIYLGCDVPFRGVYVDVTNTNGNAAALDGSYWNGSAWTDLTVTDGTSATSKTFAQDAPVTWTVPTDWATYSVNGSVNLFWVFLWTDADLDSSVSLANVVPLGIQTTQATSVATTSIPKPRYFFDRQLIGGVEATGDNTDTLVVDWLCGGKRIKFASE